MDVEEVQVLLQPEPNSRLPLVFARNQARAIPLRRPTPQSRWSAYRVVDAWR